ncbi:MAG: hypothetical protein JRH15_20705 [Deltaproteobacteria bacterium]|nr:hypothetical protein [Deltaproteobacteria bacterium]
MYRPIMGLFLGLGLMFFTGCTRHVTTDGMCMCVSEYTLTVSREITVSSHEEDATRFGIKITADKFPIAMGLAIRKQTESAHRMPRTLETIAPVWRQWEPEVTFQYEF